MTAVPTRIPWARCVCGKKAYPQRRYARKVARILGDGLHVYACPHSGAWHTGHMRRFQSHDEYRKVAS